MDDWFTVLSKEEVVQRHIKRQEGYIYKRGAELILIYLEKTEFFAQSRYSISF